MIKARIEQELKLRWKAIQAKMQSVGVEGCLLTSSVNLFYTADRVFSGYLYLPVEGEPHFFVRRPLGLKGERVHYIRKPEEISTIMVENGAIVPEKMLVETDDLSYNEVIRLQKCFPNTVFGNANTLLREVRTVKTAYEIELLKQSAALQIECYHQIASLYQPHFTDLEFSIEIERLFRQKGSLGYFRIFGKSMEIFMGSVLAGDNALAASPYDFAMGGCGVHSSLPIGPAGIPLKSGMSIMVDMGGLFTGYNTDMTRVFSVGKLAPKAYDAHQLSIDIHQEIATVAKPGVPASELYQLAQKRAEQYGLMDYFMGFGQQAGFVGHGIGIEINESPVLAPRSKEILTEGHVFALEPKFVIPGTGAVGIENCYVVTPTGIENLTVMEEAIVEL